MASSLTKPSPTCGTPSCLARCSHLHHGEESRQQNPAFASRCLTKSSSRAVRGRIYMVAEPKDVPVSSNQREIASAGASGSKVILPPRLCSLREFGEGMVAIGSDSKVSKFFELLAANIEFSYKVQDWEILSGRLAMMVFASAVLLEAVTGNSVFQKMDPQWLLEISGAIFASVLVAAGFAVALQAKTRVAYTVSKGYESMLNALIDSVFDRLLFDSDDS